MSVLLATLLAVSSTMVDGDDTVIDVTQATEFDWLEVGTSLTGEVYMIASDEIRDINYFGVPMKAMMMSIKNYQGHPDTNRLWSVINVNCDKSLYNTEWSFAYKDGTSESIALPADPQDSFKAVDAATPMAKAIEKACE